MHSNKSTQRLAVTPQRRNGKKRVSELLEAGKAVIAEKGYEGATMAEIAARAGAPIGSLYRFFPNKDAVADALIRESLSLIDTAFSALGERASAMSTAELADALLDLMVELRGRTRATLALAESRVGYSERRQEFRLQVRRHIETVLRLHHPALAPDAAEPIAFAMQHNMKVMAVAVTAPDRGVDAAAREEFRVMTRLYLEHRLGGL